MRSAFLMTMAVTVGLFGAAPAEARRGGGGYQEILEFVAPTTIPPEQSDGKQLSLCHLVKKNTVLFVPFFYESEGYALAENKCETESYIAVDAEMLRMLKADGLIDKSLPDAPSTSLLQKAVGVFWGLLILAVVVAALMAKFKRSASKKALGAMDPVAIAAIDAMCHAAKSDGRVDDSEIARIANIAGQMTGSEIAPDKIRAFADAASATLEPKAFRKFGGNFSFPQRRMIVQACLDIMASDGQVADKEQKFLFNLAAALEITPNELQAMVEALRSKA